PAGAKCKLLFRLTVTEILRGKKLVGVTARAKLKKRTVVVGSASVTLKAGETRTVRITLNRTGKALLAKRHRLPVRLRVTQTLLNGRASAVSRRPSPSKRRRRRNATTNRRSRPPAGGSSHGRPSGWGGPARAARGRALEWA